MIVRDHHVEHGFFDLDPCNLHGSEEAETVARRILEELERAREGGFSHRSLDEMTAARVERLLAWPD